MAGHFYAGLQGSGKDAALMGVIETILRTCEMEVIKSGGHAIRRPKFGARCIVTNVTVDVEKMAEYLVKKVGHDCDILRRVRVLTDEEALTFFYRGVIRDYPLPTKTEIRSGVSIRKVLAQMAEAGPCTWIISEARNVFGKENYRENYLYLDEFLAMQRHARWDFYCNTQHPDQVDADALKLFQDFTLCRNTAYEKISVGQFESRKVAMFLQQSFSTLGPILHYMRSGEPPTGRAAPARIVRADKRLLSCYRSRTLDTDSLAFANLEESMKRGWPWWVMPSAAVALALITSFLVYMLPTWLVPTVNTWLEGKSNVVAGTKKIRERVAKGGGVGSALPNSAPIQQELPESVAQFFTAPAAVSRHPTTRPVKGKRRQHPQRP